MVNIMNARYTTLLAAILAAVPFALHAATPPPASANSSIPANPFSLPTQGQPTASAAAQTIPTLPDPVNMGAPPAVSATPAAPATSYSPAPAAAAPSVLAAGPANPSLPDPVIGDSVDRVVAALGRPNGKIELNDGFLLMFDRGNVMLSPQMLVTEVKLQPLAQYQAVQAEESQQQAEAETTRVRSNALLDLLLSDPSYKSLSTRDRIVALEKFNRDHPGSNAPQDIKDLLSVYQAEIVVQSHVNDLANEARQAESQADVQRRQLTDYEKRINDLAQQVDRLQQQNAQASSQLQSSQAQPAAIQQPVYVVQQVPVNPRVVTTPSGVVITPANSFATPGSPGPPSPANFVAPNLPPGGGIYEQQPNGSYKKVSP